METDDPFDKLIDTAARSLALPIEPEWRPVLRRVGMGHDNPNAPRLVFPDEISRL